MIEMMFAVMLVGVMGSVALPAYSKYMAQSRTAEAKLVLADIFTAESFYAADRDTFDGCLDNIGVDQTPITDSYYSAGFFSNPSYPPNCGVGNAFSCSMGGCSFNLSSAIRPATLAGGGEAPATFNEWFKPHAAATPAFAGDARVTSSTEFKAGAVAVLQDLTSSTAYSDKWTIDQNKEYVHVTKGY